MFMLPICFVLFLYYTVYVNIKEWRAKGANAQIAQLAEAVALEATC